MKMNKCWVIEAYRYKGFLFFRKEEKVIYRVMREYSDVCDYVWHRIGIPVNIFLDELDKNHGLFKAQDKDGWDWIITELDLE